MPTSISCQVTHGNNNLSEQNPDGMPQSYGFHNLNRQSIFLADGTKHNYFTLPTDYGLEQAVPEPMFDVYDDETEVSSKESVDAFAGTPGQQKHEEEQQECEHARKCFSRPSKNALPEVISDFTVKDNVDVSVARSIKFKHGQCIPQVLEYAYSPGCAIRDVLLNDYKWNMLLSEERRDVWDPGDYKSFSSRLNRDILVVLSCLSQQIYCKVPPSQDNRVLQFEWDLGILSLIDTMLGKTVVPNRIHIRQTPCTLLILLGQHANLNQFWARLVPCLPCCHIPNAFLEVQYCCFPFVLDCSYSEQVQQLVYYSLMFSSTEAILYALCMSTASTLFMVLVLSSEEIAEKEKDGAAVYKVSKIQLPMRKTSHVWDPGGESILFFYKVLHVHMIQSTKWTSTSPNGIASSEYAYTMDFIIGQWEFLHEQGVQKNYSAKNLLSSPNHLQILEMDILFITFLPP